MSRSSLFFLLVFVLAGACKDQPAQDQSPGAQPSVETSEETPEPKGFDDMSSEYYEAETRVIWQKPSLVLNLLGDLSQKTVADIGAGTGYFAFRIANKGGNVIAIDIDDRAIAWMESERKRYPAEVQQRFQTRLSTATNPNLKDNEVDIILMVNTYMYIEDRVTYFRNLTRSLKKGAQIVLIDFKKKATPIGPGVDERIALSNVQRELTEAGYTILLSDDESLDYQYIIRAGLPQ